MKVLYDTILKATYIGRPNRFVVTLDLNGESVFAHLPNPGRMWELLFTGVTMYIVPHDKPDAKTMALLSCSIQTTATMWRNI